MRAERRIARHRDPVSTLPGAHESAVAGQAQRPTAPRLLRLLRRPMRRVGITGSVLLLTVPTVLTSMGITLLVDHFSPPPPEFERYALILSAAIPLVLAPLIGWFVLRLMFEAESARHVAERLAVTDPLTQAFNRRHFFRVGERAFAHAREEHSDLSVLLLDLDDFKRVNDEHGHAVGDLVLKQVAATCRAGLREHDLLARFGGEEFVVLLPGCGLLEAASVAERMRLSVQALGIPGTGAAVIRPTVSVGVATTRVAASSLDALLANADQAMYAAKRSGRNRVIAEDGTQSATTG